MFARSATFAYISLTLLLAATTSSARGGQAEDQYAVAAGHYARGEWNLAVLEFTVLLERFPSHSKAEESRFFLSEALVQQGKREEAATKFNEYLARSPEGPHAPQARFRLAETDYLAGRFDRAKQGLEAFWAARPGDPMGIYVLPYLGEIALAGNDPRTAADRFRDAIARFPDSPMKQDYRLGLGRALELLGQPDEAAAIYREIAATPAAPIAAEARFRLGALQFAAGRHDEAIATLRTLDDDAAAAAWRARGRLVRALALRKLGRLDEAATLLTDVATDAAIGVEAQYWLATVRKDQRQWDAAATILLAAAEKNPSHRWIAAIRFHAGEALRAAGRLDEAAQQYELVLGLGQRGDPWLDDAALGQIRVALARNDHAAVDRLAEEFLKRFSKSPAAATIVEQIAETAYRAENWPRAGRWFGWLAEHAGEKTIVDRGLSGLGWTQLKRGQMEEAAATFERLLARKPDARLAAQAALARGYSLERLGRFEAALISYQAALDGSADTAGAETPKLLRAAARVHNRLGQRDKAAALYERLAKDHPKDPATDAVLHEWSSTLAEANRSDEAAAVLERLCREHPESRYGAEAAYRLAQRAAEAGDRAAARKLLAGVTDENASPAIAQSALALACRVDAADEQWDDVARSAERLLAMELNDALRQVAEFWAAESLYRRGQHAAAAERFERLAGQDARPREPWMAIVPLRRAQILAQDKQWTEAHELAATIERDYPGFDRQYEVDYLLGRCLAAKAEFDAARQAYRRVVGSKEGARTETAAMAQWMIGESHFHQKDYAAALAEYLRVEILYDYPRWQAAALLQAGKCYEQLGRSGEAAKLYRRVVENYPISPFVEEAQRKTKNETPNVQSVGRVATGLQISREPSPPEIANGRSHNGARR